MQTDDVTPNDLTDKARVVAYADILGWGYLTNRSMSKFVRELFDRVVKSKDGAYEIAGLPHQHEIDEYCRCMTTARSIDRTMAEIFTSDLAEYLIPEHARGAPAVGRIPRFMQFQHVTVVRFSDSIFMYSLSVARLLDFVCELFRRAFNRGVLLRGGISSGTVFPDDCASPPNSGTENHFSTLRGSGIASAVEAEKYLLGQGMRLAVHSELMSLIQTVFGNKTPFVQRQVNQQPFTELLWPIHPQSEAKGRIGPCKEWSGDDLDRAKEELIFDERFSWNRATCDGMKKLKDTRVLFDQCLAYRAVDHDR